MVGWLVGWVDRKRAWVRVRVRDRERGSKWCRGRKTLLEGSWSAARKGRNRGSTNDWKLKAGMCIDVDGST